MKKNILPSKLNLESPVPGAESASEEVHRRWQEVIKRRSFLKGIGMIGAALSAGSLLSTGATAQTGSRNGKLSRGDVALLQFALCAELVGERSMDAMCRIRRESVDLGWYTRYRTGENPDVGAAF